METMYGICSFSLIFFVGGNLSYLFFMVGEGKALMFFLMLGCVNTGLIMLCLFKIVCFSNNVINYSLVKIVFVGVLVSGGINLMMGRLTSITMAEDGLKGYVFLCEMISFLYLSYIYF